MKYLKYFFYIIEHKWYVLIECWKVGLYWHGITHDLSKFLPSEFIPYARYFYGGKNNKEEFEKAWLKHKNRNPHHWNYWLLDGRPIKMPYKYIKQMICDWRAMSRKFGDTPREFYQNNKNKMILHIATKKMIENELDV